MTARCVCVGVAACIIFILFIFFLTGAAEDEELAVPSEASCSQSRGCVCVLSGGGAITKP